MASIDKQSNGYCARVRKKDQYGRFINETKTFTRKKDAENWARNLEISIQAATVEQLLRRLEPRLRSIGSIG